MKCSKNNFRITGFIHILALVVTFAGMGFQFYSVLDDQPYAIWLPLALTLMMFLRIPNQVCVALENSHGWFSVIGSALGLTGYIALTIVTFNKGKDAKGPPPPATLEEAQKKSFW